MTTIRLDTHKYWSDIEGGVEVDLEIDQLGLTIVMPIDLEEVVKVVQDGISGGDSSDVEKIFMLRNNLRKSLISVQKLIDQKVWEKHWGNEWMNSCPKDVPSDRLLNMIAEEY